LPRSGSTLLAGILRQNPIIHAAMSSPLAGVLNGCLEQLGAHSEFYSFFDNDKRQAMCRALFDAYYQDKESFEVIFDTNRIWTARLHQLAPLFGDGFKVICCVRNPAWIMDSFERIYRKNPFDYSQMYTAQSRQTVYARCEHIASGAGPYGQSWAALKEAYYGEFSDRLLLIDYDILTGHPQKAIQLIYQFLGLAEFAHDFDNVAYQESEFDHKLGVKGLHDVRRKVSFKPRPSILPPDLFAQFSEMAFWRDNAGTNASIVAAKKNE